MLFVSTSSILLLGVNEVIMKNTIIAVGLLSLFGCGHYGLVEKTPPCTTVQETNGVQINCPDGTNSFVSNGAIGAQGSAGSVGATGSTGASGTNGSNGTDAPPVTMVQFCSSYTTTYPSSFPEWGFCVQGHLFATYYDGSNAWTAEIVPGTYNSTSTSAPCSFVVSNNCGVTTL